MSATRVIPAFAGLVAAAVLCAPVSANTAGKPRPKPEDSVRLTDAQFDATKFQFTAPGRPRAATTVEKSFRFTPSGSASPKALAVAVTARAPAQPTGGQAARAAAASAAAAAAQEASYAVDLSVAWRGFALSGGVNRAEGTLGLLPSEGVDVGVSYGGRRWRTGVLATAERSGAFGATTAEQRYAFEAQGAYALSSKLSVNGGLRYRLSPEGAGPLTMNAEDRAVFVGGALAF
jgi:hypothetical protein